MEGLLVALIGCNQVVAGPSGEAPVAQSSFAPIVVTTEAQVVEVDLGDVRRGSRVERFIPLTNGTVELTAFQQVKTSCSCTVADPVEGTSFDAGETALLPVQIDLSNRTGSFRQSVAVKFEEHLGDVAVNFHGDILEEYPAHLRFGAVLAGESSVQRFSLRTWPGEPSLAIQDIRVDSSDIAISHAAIDTDTIQVEVTLHAQERGKSIEAMVVLQTNDREVPEKVFRVHGTVYRTLEPSNEKLVFGAIPPGASWTKSLTLTAPYAHTAPELSFEQQNPDRFSVALQPRDESGERTVEVTVNASDTDAGILRDTIVFTTPEDESLSIRAFALVR